MYPGTPARRDAIVANARRAGTLIAGVAAMLVVAGTIEGFISPQRWPPDVRIGIGAVTAAALVLYFGFSGRCANAGRRRYSRPRCLTRRYSSISAAVSSSAGTSTTIAPGARATRAAARRSSAQVQAHTGAVALGTSCGSAAKAALTAASFMKTHTSTWRRASEPSSASTPLCASGSITSVKNTISERLCKCARRYANARA